MWCYCLYNVNQPVCFFLFGFSKLEAVILSECITTVHKAHHTEMFAPLPKQLLSAVIYRKLSLYQKTTIFSMVLVWNPNNTYRTERFSCLFVVILFFLLKVRHDPTAEQLYSGQDVWHHVSGDWTFVGQSKSSRTSGLWNAPLYQGEASLFTYLPHIFK